MLLPSQWIPQPTGAAQHLQDHSKVKADSEARAARRATRKEAETNVELRRSRGQKPHILRVKPGGGIDGGCEGKNAFDEALRSLVPRILDVSVLKWKLQHPGSVEKLRSAIDNDFEYLGHSLSDLGFKNAVKRQMKTERAKMKGWFMSGKKQCPVFIEPDQWARLCEYWSAPETEQKAQMMAKARNQVKNMSNVGRTGKAGKEAVLVSCPNFAQLVSHLTCLVFQIWSNSGKGHCYCSGERGKGAQVLLKSRKSSKSLSRLALVHL